MASVHRQPNCKYWFAFFRDERGIQHKRSTRETNRKKALELAIHLENAARGRMKERGAREILADYCRQECGLQLPMTTMAAYVETWLKAKEPEIAPHSLESYRVAFSRFLDSLGERAKQDLSVLTKQDLVEFRNTLAQRYGPVTVNQRLRAIKYLFHCAKRDGYLVDDPSEFVDPVKVTVKAQREAFTLPELEAVLSAADPEWTSMIKFGLYTGQRLGDICRLTWDDIDLEEDVIHLVAGKTQKGNIVVIAPPLRAHIDAMPTSDIPGAPLHPRAFRQYHTLKTPSAVSDGFAKLLAQAGLREARKHTPTGKGHANRINIGRLSFHSLRHTAVSLLYEANVPQATVMALVGHSSRAMSNHYTHVGIESLRKAALAFPCL